MKKLTKLPVWPLKVVLVIWFIANTGCHKVFTSMNLKEQHPSWTPIEQERRMRVLSNLLKTKQESAIKKDASGSVYTIYDYFTDYADLKLLADSLGVPPIISGYMFEDLYSLGQKYLSAGHYDELGKAQAMYYARTGDRTAKPIDDKPINWCNVFSTIWSWLLSQYFRGLLPALLLLLLWFRKQKQKCTWSNAVSLILSLSVHPITVGWILISKFRLAIGEAEVRSRKEKLFAIVSEREFEMFRSVFNKKKTYRKIQTYFAEAKIERKHSFVCALIVTLLLQIVPLSFLKAEKTIEKHGSGREVVFTKITAQLVHSIDVQDLSTQMDVDNFSDLLVPEPLLRLVKIIPWFYSRILQDVPDRIDHIPLAVVSTISALLNAPRDCFTTKNMKNEKNNKNYFHHNSDEFSVRNWAHLCTVPHC